MDVGVERTFFPKISPCSPESRWMTFGLGKLAGASPGQKCGVDTRGSGGGAPAGSRGRAPGQEVRGAKPLEAENFRFFCPMEAVNLLHSPYFANSLNPR